MSNMIESHKSNPGAKLRAAWAAIQERDEQASKVASLNAQRLRPSPKLLPLDYDGTGDFS